MILNYFFFPRLVIFGVRGGGLRGVVVEHQSELCLFLGALDRKADNLNVFPLAESMRPRDCLGLEASHLLERSLRGVY